MNFKPIITLGLAAAALLVTSVAPAQASNNNNKALNQLAMQYYMQNQMAAGNRTAFNPLLTGSVYNNVIPSSLYNNVLPATYTYPVGYNYNYGAAPLTGYASGQTPWSAGCLANSGLINPGYSNLISPTYNTISLWIAKEQAKINSGNENAWQIARSQSKINKWQAQQAALAAQGYGSPYVGTGIVNNLRSYMGI